MVLMGFMDLLFSNPITYPIGIIIMTPFAIGQVVMDSNRRAREAKEEQIEYERIMTYYRNEYTSKGYKSDDIQILSKYRYLDNNNNAVIFFDGNNLDKILNIDEIEKLYTDNKNGCKLNTYLFAFPQINKDTDRTKYVEEYTNEINRNNEYIQNYLKSGYSINDCKILLVDKYYSPQFNIYAYFKKNGSIPSYNTGNPQITFYKIF